MSKPKIAVWPMHDLSRLFPQDTAPRGAASLAAKGWELAGAAGEFLGCQLGILTTTRVDEMTVSVGPLREGRDTIPAEALQVRWVGLVPVPQHCFWPDGAERPDCVPAWYPDPLVEEAPWKHNWPPRCAAAHLTVRVPADARAGRYRGRVEVRHEDEVVARMPLVVQVWPFRLPAQPTFHVTNWFQLDCITKWHRCEPWSARHWRILDLYAREMSEHRQDTVATPALMGNFHNADPMTLVDATRRKDGTWRFDMKRLDRWVKLFDAHGFRLFEFWHMAAQAHGETAPPFGVWDEAKGERVWYEKLSTSAPEYRALVGAFLRALAKWAKRRGLQDRILLHVFDEPQKAHWPRYAELSAFYREHAPALRHIDAISTSELITGFGADIDVPVPLTPHLDDADGYYRDLARDGHEPVWWYTCCGPAGRYANRFVYMPLINTRILHWQSFVRGIGGYLHWGYNFWHGTGQNASGWPGINGYADDLLLNPYREHPSSWPVGDACIVYPHPRWWEDRGPVSSLRYEAMRAGLQDYELLVLLDVLARDAKPKAGTGRAKALARARRLLRTVRGPLAGSLTEFSRDPALLHRTRRGVGESIAALG